MKLPESLYLERMAKTSILCKGCEIDIETPTPLCPFILKKKSSKNFYGIKDALKNLHKIAFLIILKELENALIMKRAKYFSRFLPLILQVQAPLN